MMFNYNEMYIYKNSNGRFYFKRRGDETYTNTFRNKSRPTLCIIVEDREIAGGVYNY